MDNIFQFDFEEEDVSQSNNNQQIQDSQQLTHFPLASNTANQITSHKAFDFDDFDDFEETQAKKQNESVKKIPFKDLTNQKEKNEQLSKKALNEEQSEQHIKQKTESLIKQKYSNLAGVQIEEFGLNQMEYVCQHKALKVTDLRKFLLTPLVDYKVKAILKKQNTGFFSNTKYNIYVEQNNRFLFSITRQGISEYIFSLSKSIVSETNKNYLGKMCSNMTGTEFLLYDHGFNPKQTRQLEYCRKQLTSINYEPSDGPRKFSTIVSTNCQGFHAISEDQNIIKSKWQNKQRDYLSILYSQAPEFDHEDGHYKLDFKGLVKKASVKNFILGGAQWEDSLIFGKIDDDTFMMQIKQPLSVLQAAAVCVSSIHYKVHWK